MIKNVLWVDDIRDPDDYASFKGCDVTWVKNYNRAIEEINTGMFDTICLDNDLGEEKEGVDIFNYIEEHLFNYSSFIQNLNCVYIHTSNTSARKTMLSACENLDRRFGVFIGLLPSKFRNKKFI
ncbi:hypothetical protein PBI_SCTP2_233 [Salicola phage SCTP-2]|nr:hypothetical protein PBI_SCTP2_233 [Salicola phage SCTP-2]